MKYIICWGIYIIIKTESNKNELLISVPYSNECIIFRYEWFSEMETIERVSSNLNSSKSSKHLFTYQEHKTKGLSTYVTLRKSMSLLMVKNVNNRYICNYIPPFKYYFIIFYDN